MKSEEKTRFPKWLRWCSKGILVIALLTMMYQKNWLTFEAAHSLLSKPSVVLVTIGMLMFSCSIAALRLFVVLKTLNISVSFQRVLGITFMGHLGANVALGPLLAEAVRLTYLVGSASHGWSHAATALVIDKLLGLGGLLLVVGGALVIFAGSGGHIWLTGPDVASLILAGSLLLILIILISPFFLDFSSNLVKSFGHEKWSEKLSFISASLTNFRVHPAKLISVLILTILTHVVSICANVYLCLMVTDHLLSGRIFAIATALGQLSNSIPVSPAGLGVGEAVFDSVCRLLSSGDVVYGFAGIFLALRMLSVVSSTPGIFAFFFLKVKINRA